MRHNHIIRGLIICMAALLILLGIMLATPAGAYDGTRITTDRQDALHAAANVLRAAGYAEDSAPIRALSEEWWREQEALDIIAKVIRYEANPEHCEWDHSVAVGAVIVNRVASDYFPNSVREVVAAPGQYLPSYTYGFSETPRLCYEAAKAALDGAHDVPADAYWQAEFPQGREVWRTFRVDTGWYSSTTFICRGVA